MKLLTLDTTNLVFSTALFADGHCLAHNSVGIVRGHTPPLSTLLDKLLTTTMMSLNDITHVAVAVGPGRFTGVRLGHAFASGMSLAGNYPLVGVGSLDAMTALFSSVPYVLAFIHGGREDAFACLYIHDVAVTPITVIDASSLTAFLETLPVPVDASIVAVGSAPPSIVDILSASSFVSSFHACDSAAVGVGLRACATIATGSIPPAHPVYGRTPSYKTLSQPLSSSVSA